MSRYVGQTLVLVFVVAFVLAPVAQVAQAWDGSDLHRFAANFRGFAAGDEISTLVAASGTPTPGSGGIVIYNKTIFVPEHINVLFVTVSGTGDAHNGARILLSCLVDDVPCNPGKIPNGAPDGWVTVQRHKDYNLNYTNSGTTFNGDGTGGAGDLHDNSVYYTWCSKIKNKHEDGAVHNIKIKLGSQNVEDTTFPLVSLEAVHFFIDGARLRGKNACKLDTTPIPVPF